MSDSSTEVVPVSPALLERVRSGAITYVDLVKELAPEAPRVPPPSKVPLPSEITSEQHAALERIKDIFGVVCPQERRKLGEAEMPALLSERQTLDLIETMAKKRKEDIRTIVFNHLDVLVEEEGEDKAEELGFERTSDGHWAVAGEVPVKDLKFTREVRDGSCTLSAEALKGLVDAGELDKDDYLGMTTQVRQFDEYKFMLQLRKKPDLLAVLRKATRRGAKVASFHVRKA